MFYRWAKRLETLQMPATAFPAAGGDPVLETDSSHQLDGALIAAAIASLWVLVMLVGWSKRFVGLDWFAMTYAPILLVALAAAFLVRPPASLKSMTVHLTAFGLMSVLMGLAWVALGRRSVAAVQPADVLVWGVFFALFGLVTGVLSTVTWAGVMHQLAAPGTMLRNNANGLRLLCLTVVLAAALIGAYKALLIPAAGL